jgi:hypothetical protein
MRQVADQANAKEEDKSYALERYSSRVASILIPPFVKESEKEQEKERTSLSKGERSTRKGISVGI